MPGPSTPVTVAPGIGAAGCDLVAKSSTRSAGTFGVNPGVVPRATWKWIGSCDGSGMFVPLVLALVHGIVAGAFSVGAVQERVIWFVCGTACSAVGGFGFVLFRGWMSLVSLGSLRPFSLMARMR